MNLRTRHLHIAAVIIALFYLPLRHSPVVLVQGHGANTSAFEYMLVAYTAAMLYIGYTFYSMSLRVKRSEKIFYSTVLAFTLIMEISLLFVSERSLSFWFYRNPQVIPWIEPITFVMLMFLIGAVACLCFRLVQEIGRFISHTDRG